MRNRALGIAGLCGALAACGTADKDETSGKQPGSKAAAVPAFALNLPSGGTAAAGAKSVGAAADAAGAAKTTTPVPITVGRAARGELTADDPILEDGTYYDAYVFEGSAGSNVTATLSSTAFDAYVLIVQEAGNRPIAQDDNGGGGTNARVQATLPAAGRYLLLANTAHGGTGAYELMLQGGGTTPGGGGGTTPPTPAGRLTAGSVTGELTASLPTLRDGEPYQTWTYQGRTGERITIDMESSAFDTYLLIGMGTGASQEFLSEDDDGGDEGTNSRLTLVLPSDGPYTVFASSYGSSGRGAYTLRLRTEAAADFTQLYPGGGDPNARYALVVGIDDYPGEQNDLRGPVADARIMRDVLVNRYGFPAQNVVMITDADAYRERIIAAFLRHLGQAGPNGTAVFYFSGHGYRLDENTALVAPFDPEQDNRDESLVVVGSGQRASILLDDELGFLADQLQAGRVLIALDACFSGTGTRAAGEGGQPKEVENKDLPYPMLYPKTWLVERGGSVGGASKNGLGDALREPQRHLLLTASSDAEVSYTASGWPDRGGIASVFTYYLAGALERATASTTFTQLMNEVRPQSVQYSRQRYQQAQTPQLEGARAGARVFEILGQPRR